jgi:hypothetical protein
MFYFIRCSLENIVAVDFPVHKYGCVFLRETLSKVWLCSYTEVKIKQHTGLCDAAVEHGWLLCCHLVITLSYFTIRF